MANSFIPSDKSHLCSIQTFLRSGSLKLDAIERTVRRLAELPHIGSIRDEICPGLRAIPTARKGVVCFVVNDERQVVKIVAIAYAGREWMNRARRREGRPN